MSVKRIYVEKKAPYAVEAKQLLWEIRHILQIKTVTGLRLLNRYDVELSLIHISEPTRPY